MKNLKVQRTNGLFKTIASLGVLLSFALIAEPTQGAPLTGVEDGEIKQHELFQFEAFVNHDDVVDGSAPFDANNQAGNDSSPNNKIVRTWDTATYPVKITINPKKADKLENIVLRVSGTLDNGIVGDRVNAEFSSGGYADLATKKVGFSYDYTIEQTGTSIMLPIAVDVKGAKHNTKLKPTIKVEVISVDGVDIKKDKVMTEFKELPSVTTSGQVNIKQYVERSWSGAGSQHYPMSRVTGNSDDLENLYMVSVSWGIDNLPGKTNMRGATFPDSKGEIHWRLGLSGDVYWDSGENTPAHLAGTKDRFDFTGRDTPLEVYDHRPITKNHDAIGSPNTTMSGKPYKFTYADKANGPFSNFDNTLDYFNQEQVQSWSEEEKADKLKEYMKQQESKSVLDSGTWDMKKPAIGTERTVGKHYVYQEGSTTGFKIGTTYPKHPSYERHDFDGAPLFKDTDRIFASHQIIVKVPNEYRMGGKNNKGNYHNNVDYIVRVTLEGYTDENGKRVKYNKPAHRVMNERNNLKGTIVQNDFIAYNGKAPIGTPRPGWASVSKGDGAVLIGEDVYFRSRLLQEIDLYGGLRGVYKWNTDAFELTEEYAEASRAQIYSAGYFTPALDQVRYNEETQEVLFGVQKFTDNSFKSFTSKGIDDYRWFNSYEEAIKVGRIGAMQNHIKAAVGARRLYDPHMPLRVRHENIGVGSETKEGTPIIAMSDYYIYLDKERTQMYDMSKRTYAGNDVVPRTYHNPVKWDKLGNLITHQAPAGSTVNFETIGVVPAYTSSEITANKSSFYNSETIKWTAKSDIKLPLSGAPKELDASVRVTHTIPKGLTYVTGSGLSGVTDTYDGSEIEPDMSINAEGETTLTWDLLISRRGGKIPDVTFETMINQFALDASSVQSSATVKSVISSDLDRRPADARTSTKSVSILKVGMVGIHESIDKLYGSRNSDYTVTLSPYTTIQDERGVTGLAIIPLSGDKIGSEYKGTAKIKAINTKIVRKNNDKVRIFLNKSPIYDDRPHEVDVTKGGWYEYTGTASQLTGATSLLFKVDGVMTSTDDIEIKMMIETAGNDFGDVYLNETVINSDTNYKLSPVSNRVRYIIRADLELALERIQIYTNKHDKGLPVNVRLRQYVTDKDTVKNTPVTLAIYDKASGAKVVSKTYKQSELKRENALIIPANKLTKNSKKEYEVRIENVNTNMTHIRNGAGKLSTEGSTSKQGKLTKADKVANGDFEFKGPVMTERELNKNMVVFNETLRVKKMTGLQTKSGYGFSLGGDVEYESDLLGEIEDMFDVSYSTEAVMKVDHNLIDSTLEYYNKNAKYKGKDTVSIALDRDNGAASATKEAYSYKLPKMYIEQVSGSMYTGNQKENGEIKGKALDAGHKIYVPIWVDMTGTYTAELSSKTPVGLHYMDIGVADDVKVVAYMFSHADSDTPDLDEIMIHPMKPNQKTIDWGDTGK